MENIFNIQNKILLKYYGESLDEIIIPINITAIKEYAFENSSIKKIILPSSLLRIGYCAFKNCEFLEDIVTSKNILYIDASVFTGCRSLKSIYFYDKLRDIGENAFNGCLSLNEVSIAETTQFHENTFDIKNIVKLRAVETKISTRYTKKLESFLSVALETGISQEKFSRIIKVLNTPVKKVTPIEKGLLINAENGEDYLYNIATDKLLMYVDLHFYTDVTFDEFSEIYKNNHRGKFPNMCISNIPDRLGNDMLKTFVSEFSMPKPEVLALLDKMGLANTDFSRVRDRVLAYTESLVFLF